VVVEAEVVLTPLLLAAVVEVVVLYGEILPLLLILLIQ
jgi:hypothetical protein